MSTGVRGRHRPHSGFDFLGPLGIKALATWSGLVAPAGTPKPIIDKLNAEVVKALKRPEMMQRLKDEGSDALGGTPQQFTDFMKGEIAKWGAVVREAGIKLD